MNQYPLAYIKKQPFHLVLFPTYFICAKYVQYQGLCGAGYALLASLQIILGVLITCFLLNLLLKNWAKSSLLTTVLAILFVFFGELRMLLQESDKFSFLSKYKFLLPLLLIFIFLFYKSIRKEKVQLHLNVFFNFLMIIYLLIEVVNIYHIPSNFITPQNKIKKAPFKNLKVGPDIYYIVADCYPSSSYQKEILGIDNSYFEDSLKKIGFYIPKQSSSNYNRTAFSMHSVFSMDYLTIVDKQYYVDSKKYALSLNQLKSAKLFTYLNQINYKLINLSIFDILDSKALLKQNFLAIPADQFFFRFSFWNYFSKDIYNTWIAKKQKYNLADEIKKHEPFKVYNRSIIDTLLSTNFSLNSDPVFVYAHLNMPHFPYYYNEHGEPYPKDSIYGAEIITSKKRFSGYIQYTNKQLLKILTSIRVKTNNEAVIILQSDHGIVELTKNTKSDAFRNFTSFYFPDGNYTGLPDTVSNVNTFRFVLNKYMQENFSILPDKNVYLSIR